MIKRSMSRNTRAKGVKVKHIVQILLLLGVCIWLIYQVKHSHDKKKELNDDDDGEERLSGKMQNDLGFLKLGRKDLDPRVEEARTSEKHEEEDEDETGGEDEERKHEEEEAKHEEEENREEEEAKPEEEENQAENEGRGGGDDEIDENDQESEENADFIDDEKEKDDGEGETETDEKGDKDDEEEEISSEDNDRDGGDEKTHEAREEHYKGDDASSAVTHDTHLINVETDEMNLDSNNLEHEEKPGDLEETNPVHDSSRIMEEGTDKTTEDENSAAVVDLDRTKSEDKYPQDSMLATQLNEQYPEANGTDQVKTEAGSGSTENLISSQTQQNEGETVYNLTDTQNFTVNMPTDGSTGNDLVPENTNSNSNLTISLKDEDDNGSMELSLKSSNENESVRPEETGSGSAEVDGESGVTEEGTDGANGSENAAQEDPIDSSDSVVGHEMEETRMDLDTLPEIRTEVDNSDETATE